jgi:hypothetical protein
MPIDLNQLQEAVSRVGLQGRMRACVAFGASEWEVNPTLLHLLKTDLRSSSTGRKF